MLLEINLNMRTHNDSAYEQINASFGADALLYNNLSDRIQKSEISEESLMNWARFVKLASIEATGINQLEEFAIIKILRSWKSIEGIILLDEQRKQSV